MSQQFVFDLPDELVSHLRKIAEETQQPFEAVAIAAMQTGAATVDTFIETPDEVIAAYTDDQLWAIVEQRLNTTERSHLDTLLAKNRSGKITPSEETELDTLIARTDSLIMERTKALVELQRRGFDIPNYIKSGKR